MPKSVFRQPGAKHFQLVHRSLRDPAIHDPGASQHVLKPIERENAKKGKTRADLEATLSIDKYRSNIGEAAIYGIYYDDTEYDYMQHLRPVGIQEEGVESVLIEAPQSTTAKRRGGKTIMDLPADVFPSVHELPRTYESQQAIPESIAGFQPDMDPHLRQTLEALEDSAFVDDELDDEFFGELVREGERDDKYTTDYEYEDDPEMQFVPCDNPESETWEEQFAHFKRAVVHQDDNSDDEVETEYADTVSDLPHIRVIGGKKRRKGTSVASGYSMSSSSMHRNQGLQMLDEQFDQLILKNYNEDEGEQLPESDDKCSDEVPNLITAREDFNFMVNEFLDEYEVLGSKLKPKLEGNSGVDKLDTIRRALGQDERILIAPEDNKEDELLMREVVDEPKDRWDCETILTTYSNLENHPRLIYARIARPVPTIRIDPRTGLPAIGVAKDSIDTSMKQQMIPARPAENVDSGSETEKEQEIRRKTISRTRDETPETKKARKASVKAEQQARRDHKRLLKEKYAVERQTQSRALSKSEPKGRKL